jgi:hypothetical protein
MQRIWMCIRNVARIALWVVLAALGGIGVALGLLSGTR